MFNAVRQAATRSVLRGPIAVLLLLITLGTALFAAIRRTLVAKTAACTACRGYGVKRCDLCGGQGFVGWEAKWAHMEPCPSCMGLRYHRCSTCGGHSHKPLFQHTVITSEQVAAIALASSSMDEEL